MIAVVIPTIPGREALYERTVDAYRATAPGVTIITVRNRPTIGQAWNEGAEAAEQAGADYLHLSADDVIPVEYWTDACVASARSDVYPSPRIMNADGTLHSCGTMGGGMLMPECDTGTPCASSPFPFMRMDDWRRIGPAPEIHYYADDYLGWSARLHGLSVEVVRGFTLTHLEGTAGRAPMVARSAADRATFLAAIAVESPAPVEVAA